MDKKGCGRVGVGQLVTSTSWGQARSQVISPEQLVQQGSVWCLPVLGHNQSLQPNILPSHVCLIGFNPHTDFFLKFFFFKLFMYLLLFTL